MKSATVGDFYCRCIPPTKCTIQQSAVKVNPEQPMINKALDWVCSGAQMSGKLEVASTSTLTVVWIKSLRCTHPLKLAVSTRNGFQALAALRSQNHPYGGEYTGGNHIAYVSCNVSIYTMNTCTFHWDFKTQSQPLTASQALTVLDRVMEREILRL